MDSREFCQIAGRLMRCPAAPYHEQQVRAAAERICSDYRLPFRNDRYGNILVKLQTARAARPLVLAAHLDHPGFEMLKGRLAARFLGGVPEEFFRPGIPVRLMPGSSPVRLGKRVGKNKTFELHTNGSLPGKFEFAVWELEDFAVRKGKIYGRSCDDLIGVAAILATLADLERTRAKVNVIGVISRAEEVGFHGALAVAADKQLPKNALIISLETSREIAPVKMGQGMIIRVGDRTSIFDSEATRYLSEVAKIVAAGDKSFRFQRALMSGGTCEATAYQEFGFQTAAVCVALANYHNCAPNRKIAAEFVSVADACAMVQLLVQAARQMPNYAGLVNKLPARLEKLAIQARKKLINSGKFV